MVKRVVVAEWSILQRQIGALVVSYDQTPHALTGQVVSDEITAANRLQIYRNNFFESLSGALLEIFPVSVAFVGDVFLRQSLKAFIAESPPEQPVLHLYGEGFPAFLRGFEPAQGVPYLADLAEMEWLTHEVMLVDEIVVERDEAACRKAAHEHCLALAESARFIQSEYPIFDLWLAATDQMSPDDVTMENGGQAILIVLREGQIRYEPVESDIAALSRVLSLGQPVPPKLFSYIRHLAERGALATHKKEWKNEHIRQQDERTD